MIGGLLLAMGILVGDQSAALLSLLPLSVLGALLVFAGAELALMIRTVRESRDFAVVIVILGVGLATNLGLGFLVGRGQARLERWGDRTNRVPPATRPAMAADTAPGTSHEPSSERIQ